MTFSSRQEGPARRLRSQLQQDAINSRARQSQAVANASALSNAVRLGTAAGRFVFLDREAASTTMAQTLQRATYRSL